ncbi:MAG: hypothetical protein AAF215_26660 [Cyanobacteria bacterium P01_A01_bin.123]
MKRVLEFIEVKKYEFEQLPLFHFMRDKTIHPHKRLGFVPCIAPYAMNFGDLNKYFLRETPPSNQIQEMINVHTYEDDHHWLWYLQDLTRLGLDHTLPLSEALKFLWSDETQHARLICTKLAMWYTAQTDSRLKLAITEAVEATGHVVLCRTAEVASELEQITQIRYPYFGPSHFDIETGHPIGTENVEDFIESIELDDATCEKACELVANVFDAFTDVVHEMMTFVETHSLENPYIKAPKAAKVPVAV